MENQIKMFSLHLRSIIGPKAVRNKWRVSVAEWFVRVQLQYAAKYLPLFLAIFVLQTFGFYYKAARSSWFLNVHFEIAEANNITAECFQPNQKLGICGYSLNKLNSST